MDRIVCTVKPNSESFAVPYSTGYQTYSGLLSLIDETDGQLADDIHETPFASLTNSGLIGPFDWGIDWEYHKEVYSDADYELRIGSTHPDDEAVFNALTKALIIDDSPLELAHGALRVTSVTTETRTHEELLSDSAEAASNGARGVRIRFDTPTCCSRYDGVWETHPDRVHLFESLADRWNATTTEDNEISLVPETLGTDLYTIPDTDRYETRSIVVHRRQPAGADSEDPTGSSAAPDGGEHLNEAQGFTGEWAFQFKGASEATQTAVIALSKFAEFAGIGRHTARGAGTVSTSVIGVDND